MSVSRIAIQSDLAYTIFLSRDGNSVMTVAVLDGLPHVRMTIDRLVTAATPTFGRCSYPWCLVPCRGPSNFEKRTPFSRSPPQFRSHCLIHGPFTGDSIELLQVQR